MPELGENEQEFLWKAIQYIEARIALVDNKATFMLALVGGLFAGLMFVTGPPQPPRTQAQWIVLIFLAGAFLLACSAVAFLLQVVRNGARFFGSDVPMHRNNLPEYFLWPDSIPKWPNHKELLLTATDRSRTTNLIETHFRVSQLVWYKYENLGRAMQFLKLLAAWIAVSILGVGLLRAFGRY